MATLYEHYNTGDNTLDYIFDTFWIAQTFTPSVTHKITSVRLKLGRYGSPGMVTVSIRATDESGHATGGDLCCGTTDGNTLTTDAACDWQEVALGAGCEPSADTKYAIVVRAASGNLMNYIMWRRDSPDPTYVGGCYEESNSSGDEGTWSSNTARDMMFEEWGEAIGPPPPAAAAYTKFNRGLN